MNRVAAIQKSSRTRQSAWRCSPSHCRSAATSSVPSFAAAREEPLLELVEHQEHLALRGGPNGCASGMRAPRSSRSRRAARETPCAGPRSRLASVSAAVASTYTGLTWCAKQGQ